MVSKNRAAKRRRAQSKKAASPRGTKAEPRSGAEAREEGPGGGPVGAMIRWGRQRSRLGFVWGFPIGAPELESELIKRVVDLPRRGSIGVARGLIERSSDQTKARMTKPPFLAIDLPTRGLKTLRSALRARCEVGALTSAMTAMICGAPLVWSAGNEEESAETSAPETPSPEIPFPKASSAKSVGFEALILERFRLKSADDDLAKSLNEVGRAASTWMCESVALAEKPLLTLLAAGRGEARESTLAGGLRRMVDQRRRWSSRHGERLLKRFASVGEDAAPDLVFLDLLSLLTIGAQGGRVQEIAEALATPLGVLCLGLCPGFVLRGGRVRRE